VVIYIILLIPALAVLLPGVAGDWLQVLPSHYFVDALHRIINFDATWSDISSSLGILFASGAVALVIGSLALRRRFS